MFRSPADQLAIDHFPWADTIAARVAKRLPPSFDVADLEQIARLETWNAAKQYDAVRGVPFEAFAFRRVSGACLMASRRRHWKNATHLDLRDVHPVPAQQEELAHSHTLADAVRDVVQRLPERERTLLYLYYWCGMPMQAIKERMGVGMTTLWTMRRSGLAQLQAELQRRNITEADLRAGGAEWASQ